MQAKALQVAHLEAVKTDYEGRLVALEQEVRGLHEEVQRTRSNAEEGWSKFHEANDRLTSIQRMFNPSPREENIVPISQDPEPFIRLNGVYLLILSNRLITYRPYIPIST
jgi:hypothetical protein